METFITLKHQQKSFRVLVYKNQYWLAVEDIDLSLSKKINYKIVEQLPDSSICYYYHKEFGSSHARWFIAPFALMLIADRHVITEIQELIRWFYQEGLPALCKSYVRPSRKHIAYYLTAIRKIQCALIEPEGQEQTTRNHLLVLEQLSLWLKEL
mgnify:FL=1